MFVAWLTCCRLCCHVKSNVYTAITLFTVSLLFKLLVSKERVTKPDRQTERQRGRLSQKDTERDEKKRRRGKRHRDRQTYTE